MYIHVLYNRIDFAQTPAVTGSSLSAGGGLMWDLPSWRGAHALAVPSSGCG